ncbi:MAG: septal ring lytic transglycosylase RlpA family protein [Cocleimonas sp.]
MKNSSKNSFLLFIILITLSACSQKQSSSNSAHSHSSSQYEAGQASYYANKYQGRQTANGERFNQNARTAAHKTLKFGTRVKVTNVDNGRSVIVRINDRGPFIKGRIIDLSKSSFSIIANPRLGIVKVKVEILR